MSHRRQAAVIVVILIAVNRRPGGLPDRNGPVRTRIDASMQQPRRAPATRNPQRPMPIRATVLAAKVGWRQPLCAAGIYGRVPFHHLDVPLRTSSLFEPAALPLPNTTRELVEAIVAPERVEQRIHTEPGHEPRSILQPLFEPIERG